MLMAGSKWKIYTRHGGVMLSINKNIVLNQPDKEKVSSSSSLMARYPWYSEDKERKDKLAGIWNSIEKIHPNVRILWVVQVEDYYCLVSDGLVGSLSNDYRMFPE